MQCLGVGWDLAASCPTEYRTTSHTTKPSRAYSACVPGIIPDIRAEKSGVQAPGRAGNTGSEFWRGGARGPIKRGTKEGITRSHSSCCSAPVSSPGVPQSADQRRMASKKMHVKATPRTCTRRAANDYGCGLGRLCVVGTRRCFCRCVYLLNSKCLKACTRCNTTSSQMMMNSCSQKRSVMQWQLPQRVKIVCPPFCWVGVATLFPHSTQTGIHPHNTVYGTPTQRRSPSMAVKVGDTNTNTHTTNIYM